MAINRGDSTVSMLTEANHLKFKIVISDVQLYNLESEVKVAIAPPRHTKSWLPKTDNIFEESELPWPLQVKSSPAEKGNQVVQQEESKDDPEAANPHIEMEESPKARRTRKKQEFEKEVDDEDFF